MNPLTVKANLPLKRPAVNPPPTTPAPAVETPTPSVPDHPEAVDCEQLVQSIRAEIELVAYQIWKQAGEPEGTAKSDWLEAEQLVWCRLIKRKKSEGGGSHGHV